MRLAAIMIANVVATVITVSDPANDKDVDGALLARIKGEAMAAWREAEAFTDELEVTCDERVVESYVDQKGQKGSRSLHWRWTATWDRAHGRRLIELHTPSAGVVSRRVINPTYRFLVYRNEKSAQWVLGFGRRADVSEGEESASAEQSESKYEYRLKASCRLCGLPLESIFSDPDFTLETAKLRESAFDVQPLVFLQFKYSGARKAYRRPGGHYWVELDPSRGWRIVKAGFHVPDTAERVSDHNHYGPETSAPYLPVTVESDWYLPRADFHRHAVFTFTEPQRPRRADDEYYLTYYGIPETALVAQASGGSAIWRTLAILGSLGILAAVYFVLRVLERRLPKH